MPPRRAPAVAADPAIVHAAYVQAGSVRGVARLLGIAKSTVSDLLTGKSRQMSTGTAERVGRAVANDLNREQRRDVVGTANLLRERSRGDPTRLGAERVNLQLHQPDERRQLVREQQRLQTAAGAEYQRYVESQRDRTRSPDRRQSAGPFRGTPSLFGDLADRD